MKNVSASLKLLDVIALIPSGPLAMSPDQRDELSGPVDLSLQRRRLVLQALWQRRDPPRVAVIVVAAR